VFFPGRKAAGFKLDLVESSPRDVMTPTVKLPFETETVQLYCELKAHDPKGNIKQFRSLPAANQYRRLYHLTAQYVLPGARVLDWGCGRGHFAYYLLKRGLHVTCYSLRKPPQIFNALDPEAKSRLTFIQGNEPIKIPLPSNHFDTVFSVGVLEHVRETNGAEIASLLEIQRLLVPGGHLVVYHFPNRLSYIEALSRLSCRLRPDSKPAKYHHQYLFSLRDVDNLVDSTELTLIEKGRYGFLPRNMFSHLPSPLRSSQSVTSLINLTDRALETAFSPIVQNLYFVARNGGSGQN
jgi:2-polyprenyl-3-methyl-5-hydroxy-6-metoxy-1,4-benzoquinol methylase